MKTEEYNNKIKVSRTYSKASNNSREVLETLLKQLIALGFLDIKFMQFKFEGVGRMCRRFFVSADGNHFISAPCEMLLPDNKNQLPVSKVGKSVGARSKGGGRQYLPLVRELLASSQSWKAITKSEEYMFPGFEETGSSNQNGANILVCHNWRDCQSGCDDFLMRDCQLAIGSTTIQTKMIAIDGKETEVSIRRGVCQGVKRCQTSNCNYVVSRAQHANRCSKHGPKVQLVVTGPCPVNLVYVTPTETEDRRRWLITISNEVDRPTYHSHEKPSPHGIPTKLQNDLTEAVCTEPSRTASQLQKGNLNSINKFIVFSLFNIFINPE